MWDEFSHWLFILPVHFFEINSNLIEKWNFKKSKINFSILWISNELCATAVCVIADVLAHQTFISSLALFFFFVFYFPLWIGKIDHRLYMAIKQMINISIFYTDIWYDCSSGSFHYIYYIHLSLSKCHANELASSSYRQFLGSV